jgi:hypothetical protein
VARRSPARRITERDREILRWTGQGGIASLSQLARRFWPCCAEETALDRLRQLVKADYLAMYVWDQGTGLSEYERRLFTLTERGFLLFSPAERLLFYTSPPSPAEVRQQLLAQEAYLELETQARSRGARLLGWKSERVLRGELRQRRHRAQPQGHPPLPRDIPDAEVTILTASGERQILYIEMDGAYYGKMLWQKADNLGKAGYQVLWVCTEARAKYIQEAVARYPNIRVLSLYG